MKKLIASALAVSALALSSTAGAATLVNNGFESGLTGWQAAPDTLVSVVSNFTNVGTNSTYSPVEVRILLFCRPASLAKPLV